VHTGYRFCRVRPVAVAVDLRAKPRAKRFFMQRLMKALSAKRPRYLAGIGNQIGFLMLRINPFVDRRRDVDAITTRKDLLREN
jgi:hypothetical protein